MAALNRRSIKRALARRLYRKIEAAVAGRLGLGDRSRHVGFRL